MEITHKHNLNIPMKYENTLMQRNTINNLAQSFNLNPSQKYQNALMNLREGLTELGNLNDEKERKRKSNTNYNLRVNNFIKDIQNKKPINTKIERNKNNNMMKAKAKNISFTRHSKKLDNTFFTQENKNYTTIENKSSTLRDLNPPQKNQSFYSKYITDDEHTISNNILKKPNEIKIIQINKNLIKKNQIYQKKIKELMDNIKKTQLNNQKLINDKNNFLKKINSIENEFKKSKEHYNIEIEIKNKNIMLLKKEIMKLNILLKKKKEEIENLKNAIFLNKESEIKTLDDNLGDKNNNIIENKNITDLLSQINSLKNQLKDIKTQNENKNNTIKLLQSENQKRIAELNKKINLLKEENDHLKNNPNKNFQSQMNILINENNELKNKITNLENINNNDNYNNINRSEQNNNNINNINEFNFIKKDLDAKKLEISNLNDNILNLTNDLNKYKNFNEVLTKDIFSLRGEIDKLHKKELLN